MSPKPELDSPSSLAEVNLEEIKGPSGKPLYERLPTERIQEIRDTVLHQIQESCKKEGKRCYIKKLDPTKACQCPKMLNEVAEKVRLRINMETLKYNYQLRLKRESRKKRTDLLAS